MAMVKAQIPEGYATIRRSKSRGARKIRTASVSSMESQPTFEMIELSNRNSLNRSGTTLYSNHQNDIYDDDAGEVDEGVINDIEADVGDVYDVVGGQKATTKKNEYFCDNQRTLKTFKPQCNGIITVNQHQGIEEEVNVSARDLRQTNNHHHYNNSNDEYQSLPYDLLMTPLKSPQYINQLNSLRNGAAGKQQQQIPLYARPDSPKYGKIHYNRSTSPSADSMDNCSSNSSTYSSAYRQASSSVASQDDDNNLILVNQQNHNRRPPLRSNTLNYRKSFSCVNRAQPSLLDTAASRKKHSQEFINFDRQSSMTASVGGAESSSSSFTMTKSLAMPSVSTSNLYTKRYATLAHPSKDHQRMLLLEAAGNTKSTSSLNENHVYWDPILESKIGSQTTLRTKPILPWWELACKKDHRQSCPPMQAHVVNAFEKSLATMTARLQSLTATTEKKESELTEMRQTIELLKKQSIQAGLTSAHIASMGPKTANGRTSEGSPTKKQSSLSHLNGVDEIHVMNEDGSMQRHLSTDSVCSINSIGSNCSTQDKKKKKGWLRSSFTKAFSRNNGKMSKASRQTSLSQLSESRSSLPPTPAKLPAKLPSEPPMMPTNHNNHLNHHGKPPISPTKASHHHQVTLVENAKPHDAIEVESHPVVEDLKKQLREKDMVLTDIRLEALTQASQMENLKETVRAMRQEMMALKHNNDRLQKMVMTRSIAGSDQSLGGNNGGPSSPINSACDSRRYSYATDTGYRPPLELPQHLDETEEEDNVPAPAPNQSFSPVMMSDMSPTLEGRHSLSNEVLTTPAEEIADPIDGKRILVAVYLGQPETIAKFIEESNELDHEDGLQVNGERVNGFYKSHDEITSSRITIANTYISGKTTWQNLDYIVRKTFKDYLSKIDPGTNLGLNTDSITSYHLGEAKRGPDQGYPDLLPCGYIVGNVKTLYICLQGVGSLAFDTLIPRSIVHRYINLLTEHRRLILCGPSGTGKSYLARKLAEFLVAKSHRSNPVESIATFNVDHKSSKDLQQYLGHIAEQASIACDDLPAVIILDNLHHASALGDVFSCLLSADSAKLPCIIGTMSQATCSTANLQLHHNFRWVLTANHMEPVKGFLGRFLRRRLFDYELQTNTTQTLTEKVYRWLPSVLHHINSFLETHSSSDVTIGPKLFLDCPIDANDSQIWFLEIWNENLAPYLIDAIKEGVQLYGRRGNSWIDPCQFVRETYPWNVTPTSVPKLKNISADDVGLEAESTGNKEDPLLNMLNQLKEAASWNEGHQDDSDCVSLDSNFTHDSSIAEP